MLELYLSELRRFRTGAAIYAAASLLLLILLSQVTEVANGPAELHVVMLGLYMVSGLGFALYQFGTYRQSSRWIWLQHRPLHRVRILGAIALASASVILLAMALPLLVFTWAQDHTTSRVVDTRHYAGAAFLALSALGAWLAGAYMMLHRSRWAFVILLLPMLLTFHRAAWPTMLGLAVASDLVLLVLVVTVFRPNRLAVGETWATVAAAVPLQASFYLALLWAGSSLFQVGLMALGVHPLNGENVPRAGVTEAMRYDRAEILQAGLAACHDPRAPAWAASIKRNNTAFVGPYVRQYAVRDLITTFRPAQWQDGAQNFWTFSHDRMMYRGVNKRTRAARGWFGTGGAGDGGSFGAQPVAVTDNRGRPYFTTARDLYALQPDERRLEHVIHVEGAEQLGGTVAVLGARTMLLTNRRLIVLEDAGGMQARATIPLDLPFGDLARVEAAQVADGTLVSFVYGKRRNDGVGPASHIVYLVDAGGRVTRIARRELEHDFALLFEHKDWWLSPLLFAAVNLPDMLIENGIVPDDGASRFAPVLLARPAGAWMAAIVLALASLAGALWWTGLARLSPRQRVVWCAACLVLGLPALLSLMVLQPRAVREGIAARAAAM